MSQTLTITPLSGAFTAHLSPPGSKSLTNRALLLAGLAQGRSVLRGILEADDTRHMQNALTQLGVGIESSGEHTLQVTGHPNLLHPATQQEALIATNQVTPPKVHVSASSVTRLHLGNAGTAYRFLTAVCSLARGHFELEGIARMHQRPIGELVQMLQQLGANILYGDQPGYPPLHICGKPLRGGCVLTVKPTLSSQYISALLQIAPFMEGGLSLRFEGPVTSRPYVEMTLQLMSQFGVNAKVASHWTRIDVPQGVYQAVDYAIEPDASGASYFLAAAALIPGSKCTIEGLGFRSCQGDAGFAELLQQMGAGVILEPHATTVMGPPVGESLHALDVDMNDMPDMAQTLAAVALFAEGTTVLRNIGNLRVKETDRMAAIQNEWTRLGATVRIEQDDLFITPPSASDWQIPKGTVFQTYDDHRMAMSLAIVGLVKPGLTLENPECVNKTFPCFFEYLEKLKTD